MSEENDDIGADVRAAMEQLESTDDGTQEEVSQETGQEESYQEVGQEEDHQESGQESGTQGRARDEKGRFASNASKEVADGGGDSIELDGDNSTTSDVAKPPASWGAGARQDWASVPESAQREILKREHEINNVLNDSSDSRKTAQAVGALQEKYAAGLQSTGTDLLTAADSLFQTETSLRFGTPAQKAAIAAQIIQNYGVDIKTLDGVLRGQIDQQQIPQQQQPMQDPRFDQFLAQMGQQAQAQQAQHEASVQTEVDSFINSKPYGNDVKGLMADFLDVAAAQGLQPTLDDVYHSACLAHPEVSKLYTQELTGSQRSRNNAQRSRQATGSVRTSPADNAAVADNVNDGSIRGAIQHAMNHHS